MKISAIKPPREAQQTLWPSIGDRPLTMAATRNYCGEFYEEATCNMFGADRHKTDGTADICPDLSIGNHYLECKSIGLTRQGLIYSQRLEHDRWLLADGGKLSYVFWIHNVEAGKCSTLWELRDQLAVGAVEVLVIPFEEIEAACRMIPGKVMNYRAATTKQREKQEMVGHRLPYKLLKGLATSNCHRIACPVAFARNIAPVRIYSRCPPPRR